MNNTTSTKPACPAGGTGAPTGTGRRPRRRRPGTAGRRCSSAPRTGARSRRPARYRTRRWSTSRARGGRIDELGQQQDDHDDRRAGHEEQGDVKPIREKCVRHTPAQALRRTSPPVKPMTTIIAKLFEAAQTGSTTATHVDITAFCRIFVARGAVMSTSRGPDGTSQRQRRRGAAARRFGSRARCVLWCRRPCSPRYLPGASSRA